MESLDRFKGYGERLEFAGLKRRTVVRATNDPEEPLAHDCPKVFNVDINGTLPRRAKE